LSAIELVWSAPREPGGGFTVEFDVNAIAEELFPDAAGVGATDFSPGFDTAPHAYCDSVGFGLAEDAVWKFGSDVRQPTNALALIRTP